MLRESFDIDAEAVYPIRVDLGDYGGALVIQFTDDGDFAGTGPVLVGRAKGAAAYLAVPYAPVNVAGTAGDEVADSAAIVADGIIRIPVAGGMEFALDASASGAVTAGTLTATVVGIPAAR